MTARLEFGSEGAIAPMSVVAFSLSKPDVILDRGTWARDRRERGRVAVESGRVDILAACTRDRDQSSMIHAQGRRGSRIRDDRIRIPPNYASCASLHVAPALRRVEFVT